MKYGAVRKFLKAYKLHCVEKTLDGQKTLQHSIYILLDSSNGAAKFLVYLLKIYLVDTWLL